MSEHKPDLARVLDAGMRGTRLVVAVYEMAGAGAVRETYPERDWLRELASFHELVVSDLGSVGRRDFHATLAGTLVQVVYPWDLWLAALMNARAKQQRVSSEMQDLAWGISVGLAAGEALEFYGPDGSRQYAGWVVDRATALAKRAKNNQVFVDPKLCDQAEMNQPHPGSEFELRFGGLHRAPIQGISRPVQFREFIWGAGELWTEDHARNPIRKGILTSWADARGLIVTDAGERYYIDKRYTADSAQPKEGMRVIFVPEQPRDSKASNPLATAAVFIGMRIEGRIASVELHEDRAYIEVRDKSKHSQRLITARETDLTGLTANSFVSFTVDENARGAVATDIIVTHAAAPQSGRPDVASRFMSSLTQHLRQSGKGRAAAAVLRASSVDWVPSRVAPRHQRAQLFALANYAVEHWAVRGLRKIQDDDLAAELIWPVPIDTFAEAIDAERILGELRSRLKDRGASDPHIPVRREAVIEILTELQLGMRHLSWMRGAQEQIEEDQEAALATQHFAFALSQAFAAGVVTSLPPESRDVFNVLAQAQG